MLLSVGAFKKAMPTGGKPPTETTFVPPILFLEEKMVFLDFIDFMSSIIAGDGLTLVGAYKNRVSVMFMWLRSILEKSRAMLCVRLIVDCVSP